MATLKGTTGPDSITGTTDADSITSGNGDDTVFGLDGNDTINSGSGTDIVHGGEGADSINGAQNGDTIYGEGGDDNITGHTGSDYIDGGAGNDTIEGGFSRSSTEPENDTIIGGEGRDSISANVGDDLISGDSGDDWIQSGVGNDTAHGGSDNDTVYGNEGEDYLYGDAGNDLVQGGPGSDYASGGEGDDTVVGDNTAGSSSVVGDDTLDGDAGNDSLWGGYGQDILDGGEGTDTLTGGEGYDTFIAGDSDIISDFNTATDQDYADGNPSNNDFVDLSEYYNDANLITINAAREAQGLKPYHNALSWMRADQDDDGVLNDISTTNGFNDPFTFTIQNGGAAVAGSDLTYDNTNVVCFGADALIQTGRGDIAAGDLQIGDPVQTRDFGAQPIRWIGHRRLDAVQLHQHPNLRPVRICKGALGSDLPHSDLIVSPQHRILVRSKIAQKMFGAAEVLVAAKQLCQIDGIDIADDLDGVTYVHFLFDQHQIVLANGAETESLFTGPAALESIGPAAREEVFAIFPELRDMMVEPASVRPIASGRLGRKLAVRHARNGKALVG